MLTDREGDRALSDSHSDPIVPVSILELLLSHATLGAVKRKIGRPTRFTRKT